MPSSVIDQRVSLNGATYHYAESGSGDPLVLLHGFTGSAATWREHVDYFAASRRVIAVDLLGHGSTDSPSDAARCTIEHAAADLIALFDSLTLSQVMLVGYSMGGRLALYTAITYSQRITRLILESASPGLADAAERAERLRADHALADRVERDGIPAFVAYWENLPLFASQKRLPVEVQAHIRGGRLANNPIGLANSLRGMGAGVQPPLWSQLSGVSAPVRLIVGCDDQKYVRIAHAMIAAGLPADLVVIPHAGHTPHLEQPTPFQHAVTDFV